MFENLLSFSPPLAAVHINDLWYSLPLIVTISLVYAATRQEQLESILWSAARFGGWISACMAVAFGVLYMISVNL
jgi:hypothetical protein